MYIKWHPLYHLRLVSCKKPSLQRYIKRPGVAIRTSTLSWRFCNWVFCLKPPVATTERNGTPNFDSDRQLTKTWKSYPCIISCIISYNKVDGTKKKYLKHLSNPGELLFIPFISTYSIKKRRYLYFLFLNCLIHKTKAKIMFDLFLSTQNWFLHYFLIQHNIQKSYFYYTYFFILYKKTSLFAYTFIVRNSSTSRITELISQVEKELT